MSEANEGRKGWRAAVLMFGVALIAVVIVRLLADPPLPRIAPEVIEKRHPEAVAQLRAALKGKAEFTAKDVLDARVETDDGFVSLVKPDWEVVNSEAYFPRQPEKGKPVVNRIRLTLKDGRVLSVLSYEILVGEKRGILVVDEKTE